MVDKWEAGYSTTWTLEKVVLLHGLRGNVHILFQYLVLVMLQHCLNIQVRKLNVFEHKITIFSINLPIRLGKAFRYDFIIVRVKQMEKKYKIMRKVKNKKKVEGEEVLSKSNTRDRRPTGRNEQPTSNQTECARSDDLVARHDRSQWDHSTAEELISKCSTDNRQPKLPTNRGSVSHKKHFKHSSA